MGSPLTKTTIIGLANDLIADTEYLMKIKDCKALQKLQSTEKHCNAWYRGFMSRFSEQITRSGTTIKDSKRNTWVAKENFVNMYENVYEAMVAAGIAEKEKQEIEYETRVHSKF
jgi:hypothetical protein